jgi:hypothetical protein
MEHMFFFQGLAPVWAQAVASIFWKNLWHLYKTVEISTAAQVI